VISNIAHRSDIACLMNLSRIRGTPSWNGWHCIQLQRLVDTFRAPYKDGHSLPMRSIDDYAPIEADGLPGVRLSQLCWIGYVLFNPFVFLDFN
jgi:hypothetical protein